MQEYQPATVNEPARAQPPLPKKSVVPDPVAAAASFARKVTEDVATCEDKLRRLRHQLQLLGDKSRTGPSAETIR